MVINEIAPHDVFLIKTAVQYSRTVTAAHEQAPSLVACYRGGMVRKGDVYARCGKAMTFPCSTIRGYLCRRDGSGKMTSANIMTCMTLP